MKRILSLLACCFLAAVTFAQSGTITIKVNGNKNREIMLDGRTYTADATTTNNKNIITITGVQPGTHTLQVVKTNNRKINPVTTTFTLQPGYDVNITVNGNGGVRVADMRSTANTAVTMPSMADAEFNSLLSSVNRKWFNSSKVNAVNDAFANTNYHFTVAQVSQLLQAVSGEDNRLKLAKASYNRIVDPANFTNVYGLLSQQSSRDELAAYVNTNYNNNNNTAGSYRTPISSTDFNSLLQNIQSQWRAGAKYNLISNALNGNYYFSSAQARQLIQQLDDESNRLQLAKLAYRNITDVNNFSMVYELLSSQSARNELASYIRQNGGDVATSYSETYRTPMSDVNFQAVLENVRRQWLPGAKMQAVSVAIATTTNYFSTAQIRQLVSLVTADNNRLQLLKSAYANATDRSNYSSLYDLLNSQTSRDELTQYINSYTGY